MRVPFCLALAAALTSPAPAHAIYRGAEAHKEETPWMVTFSSRGVVACGGALITSDRVITAAHCVAGRDPKTLRMRIGGGSLRAARLMPPAKTITFARTYEEVLPKPDAAPSQAATLDDLAIVTLSKPVVDPPIAIAETAPTDGETTTTYGRGRTRDLQAGDRVSPVSDRVLRTTQAVVAREECERIYGRLHDPERHLCTIDANTKSKACAGDSGGPVVVTRNAIPELAGVVTWGDETKGFDCAGGGFPDVSELARAHQDLINSPNLPQAPFAHRRVRVRTDGDTARCVIGDWGGTRPAFQIRWYREGRIRVRGSRITRAPDSFVPGATRTTISKRKGPLYCEVTATSEGGVATERSYNGAWAPARSFLP